MKRYLVVGGAGSLEVAPGVKLVDTPEFPSEYKQEALKGAAFLDLLRREQDLDWTFLSPSAVFGPGERTGQFRLGTDQLLASERGLFLDPHEGRRNVSSSLRDRHGPASALRAAHPGRRCGWRAAGSAWR